MPKRDAPRDDPREIDARHNAARYIVDRIAEVKRRRFSAAPMRVAALG